MNMLKNKIYKIFNEYIKHYRDISEINYNEAMEVIKNNTNTILLDVRSMQEYQEYHLNNAINIPLYDLHKEANNKLKRKEDIIIVYCQSGARSKKAMKFLKDLNFINVYNLKGRIKFNIMSLRLLSKCCQYDIIVCIITPEFKYTNKLMLKNANIFTNSAKADRFCV